jgi:hypothetical protein
VSADEKAAPGEEVPGAQKQNQTTQFSPTTRDRESGPQVKSQVDPRKIAERYVARGWAVVPIKRGEKGPKSKDWLEAVFGPEYFSLETNIGVKLGEKSGGLVDIDLDDEHAVAIADETLAFAPSFGRAGNPRSHRLLRVRDPGKTTKWQVKSSIGMVLELRSSGVQTVFPGSVHPSGEAIEWTDGEPGDLPERGYEEVVRLCRYTAFLAIVLRHYPKQGSRDEACMALSGVLLRMGLEPEHVDDLVRHLAQCAGDEEWQSRGKAQQTKGQLDADGPATGMPKLLELLGITDEVARRKMVEWAGVGRISAASVAVDENTIVVADGRLARIVEDSERLLIAKGMPIYQRGRELVRPVRHDRPTADEDLRRQPGSVVIQPVGRHALRMMMARAANWVTLRLDGCYTPTDPPLQYADALLDVRPLRFPRLLGVAGSPVMRADGTVAQAEGYDPATELLLDFGGVTFPPVPDAPTRDDALCALGLLKRPFRAYEFEDRASASVVYSAMLTTAISRVVPAVPGHVFDASTAGYGKSKIADCVSLLATGTRAAVMSQGKNPEEDEKRIGAALRGGDPLIAVDNIEQPIAGDKLCSAITQATVSLRILGQSLNVELPSRTMFLFTGNNVRVHADMCRRVLRCRIGGDHERPDKRQFDFDPVKEVEAQRTELVVAALAVLRAYVAAGRPRRDLPPIGSFEDWNVVREALVWLDEEDPELTREEVMEDDEEREDMQCLLLAIRAAMRDQPFTVAELRDAAKNHHGLIAALSCDPGVGRAVSARLKKLQGRVLGGFVLRVVREDGKRGHTYRVDKRRAEAAEPTLPPSPSDEF